jgi:hypothetical protein
MTVSGIIAVTRISQCVVIHAEGVWSASFPAGNLYQSPIAFIKEDSENACRKYGYPNSTGRFYMLNKFKLLLNAGVGIAGCVAAIGAAQATTLTAIDGIKHDTSWQNIASASYTYTDANHDGKLNVGEKLVFTVEMDKQFWGRHVFDALKVWIGGAVYTGKWNFSTATSLLNPDYDRKIYNKPNQSFAFDYIATNAGPLDLYASVMCNDDLSKLVRYDGKEGSDGVGTDADWAAWSYGINRYQGEDKHYQLNVSPVPEPETYAMLLVGLGMLGFSARRRKDFTA